MNRKLLIGYLILSGLAAHGLLLAVIILRPHLILDAKARIENRLAQHSPDVFASDARRAAQIRVILTDVVEPWQASPGDGQTPPGKARISARLFDSPRQAGKALKDGETLYIGAGAYTEPLVLTASGIRIIGVGHVQFRNAQAEGKGTIIVRGRDVAISNIECSEVRVADGNGACIRLIGQNLELDHVFFHDSEQGLLTGNEPGNVVIRDSWFARLGHGGSAHGIYVGGGNLKIFRSIFLASRDQGHEIKTRAQETHISASVIASLDGVDSRLIDASNGGRLTIENSVLEEGPQSSNLDVIGYGLEKNQLKKANTVAITNNTIILERLKGNRLLHLGIEPDSLKISGNVIVGPDSSDQFEDNQYYPDRNKAGMQDYPMLGR